MNVTSKKKTYIDLMPNTLMLKLENKRKSMKARDFESNDVFI